MPADGSRSQFRFLVIGCGSIGKRHIGNLIALEAGKILAFDIRTNRRREVASQLGVKVLDNLEEAWKHRPNVALITVPTHLHISAALQAAEQGCHLFIEKPLAGRLDDVDRLLEIVNKRNLLTLIACNMRFHPGPLQLKQLLDEGAIGKVISARLQTGSYLPNWRSSEDYRQSYSASAEQGGGAILDCIHELDLAMWYFGPGEVVSAVTVPAKSIGLEVEGLAEILIRHESGVLSSVHLNFVQRDYRRSCQIIGTDGTLYWDFEVGKVRWYTSNGEYQVFDQPTGWVINQMYLDEMIYFLQCMEDGIATFNSVEYSLAILKMALRAKEGAWLYYQTALS